MLTVAYAGGDRLRISVRGHDVYADQPVEDGGADTAPTPTELFAGALAACIAFYAERFFRRHGLDPSALTVACDYAWAENPHRVGEFELVVDAPGLPDGRRQAFMRVLERCTLHNTLETPPAIRIRLDSAAPPAA